jgi:hypothetical protein
MSDPEQQPKRKNSLTTIVVLLIGFGVGYIASGIVGFVSGLAPEYNSAAVIREITAFVEKNKAWPTSWGAIGMEPLSRVKVNWSLDVNTCDRHDVVMSVAPETGGFYTYPHAERQLGDLWLVVLRVQDERSNQAVNGSRR